MNESGASKVPPSSCDFLVIGGGVMGIAIALELRKVHPDASVTVLEKESAPGAHGSGRNSGVLHAGFYYSSDSLQAKFTAEGARELREFCDAKKLNIKKCGKLVVASTEKEEKVYEVLLERARKAGVVLEQISAKEAKKIEPRVRTTNSVLWSPNTATMDPLEVLNALRLNAEEHGVRFYEETEFKARVENGALTNRGVIKANYVVNAGGLHADKIAQSFGFSENYQILPFRVFSLNSNEPAGSINTCIYSAPNPENPYLGCYFTLTVSGRWRFGPVVLPALWRENYGGVSGFEFADFMDVASRHLGLVMGSKQNLLGMAKTEIAKLSTARMVRLAQNLLEGVQEGSLSEWGRPAIRAQLVNNKTKDLEMDYIIEGDKESIHVLNAISPAYTSSGPFARHIVKRINELRA